MPDKKVAPFLQSVPEVAQEIQVYAIPGNLAGRGRPVLLNLPVDLTDEELLEVYKFVGSALDVFRAKRVQSPLLVPSKSPLLVARGQM